MAGLAEQGHHLLTREAQQIGPGANRPVQHLLFRDPAHPVKLADRQGGDEGLGLVRRDHGDAVGFVVARGDLGQEFIVGNAGRSGQPGGLANGGADGLGDPGGRGFAEQVVGDVEKGLVHRKRFDQRRVAAEQGHDLARDLLVARHPGPEENGLGAELLRPDAGHGRVDAKGSRLVGTGRDHAPTLGRAADNHRQAAQFGAIPLLDRGVEGVHVDVDDFAGERHGKGPGWLAMLSLLTLTAVKAIIPPDRRCK